MVIRGVAYYLLWDMKDLQIKFPCYFKWQCWLIPVFHVHIRLHVWLCSEIKELSLLIPFSMLHYANPSWILLSLFFLSFVVRPPHYATEAPYQMCSECGGVLNWRLVTCQQISGGWSIKVEKRTLKMLCKSDNLSQVLELEMSKLLAYNVAIINYDPRLGPHLSHKQGLWVNQWQCCQRVAASPYRPNGPITQLIPFWPKYPVYTETLYWYVQPAERN